MVLLSGLLLPLAPARGAAWVAGRIADTAERQLTDPAPVHAQLAELHQVLEDGEIGTEEFEAEEERLLRLLRDRLAAASPAPVKRPSGRH
ncbi:gas vesicle protein GvpG [Streptomyces litchfieldiae]|uniref:Gas vesicle protein GvpG n=1 Tax=Streptomyces litchfieldiae TaxID=3075543 RepID=A0ABU2MIX1_9ACTN|nr:gas vesicle protein GvpG [Streptomyces sp. DSM 44938]MDT0341416.1 gas vesicle protein GvpG [Streptomyces sp. DSM 44938]